MASAGFTPAVTTTSSNEVLPSLKDTSRVITVAFMSSSFFKVVNPKY